MENRPNFDIWCTVLFVSVVAIFLSMLHWIDDLCRHVFFALKFCLVVFDFSPETVIDLEDDDPRSC